jgi:hypothetical protein
MTLRVPWRPITVITGVRKIGVGMPRLLNNPAHWHLRAQEAQLLAAQLQDPVAKAATLKIAAEYERLAARAARREADESEETVKKDAGSAANC